MITDFTIPLGKRDGFTVDAVEHDGDKVIVRTSGLKHVDGVFIFVKPHGMVPDGTFSTRRLTLPDGSKRDVQVADTKYDAGAFLEAELARAIRMAVK